MFALLALACLTTPDTLHDGFLNPPPEARTRAYWWWLNGNVTKDAIARDLREMAAKGFGGAVIVDAGGADQRGNAQVPHGPDFFSPKWRDLFRFTIAEAKKDGIELSLNIQSGWNLGGPMVRPQDAPKKLVWSETIADPTSGPIRLAEPTHAPELYGEVAVLAYPVSPTYDPNTRATLTNWQQKALLKPLPFSAPGTSALVEEGPDIPGEQATPPSDTSRHPVLDLSSKLKPDGTLDWRPTSGRWEVVRIGYTLNDHCRVSTNSQGWDGYAIDPFDKDAFDRYWNAVVEPLIADAGPEAGKTLRYLHTDSWEVEVANWTPTLLEEFKKRRGYDLKPYLPVLLGRIVQSRSLSQRVLNDFRRTMGDLAIDHHYRPFRDYAHRHRLLIHPESGGPHAVPIDSLQCLGMDDAPMSEFWASAATHRVTEEDRFFVKQPASAAHTYGHNLVLAEGFTTIGPHWQETIWDNLRPNFDRACTEGMNRLVWHAFVCSPDSEGVPGQQYFAGTHMNPNVTWWNQSEPFIRYLNRCQFMLQRGRFVADALYYYGDHVPNFAQLKKSDPAGVLPGYDYDVATSEIVQRLKVTNGRLTTPEGMTYRLLVLPIRPAISLPVLRKIEQLVNAGATVIGPKPTTTTGLSDSIQELHRIAQRLWGAGNEQIRRVGRGRVALPGTAALLLANDDIPSDFAADENLNYIHRRDAATDIYFVANSRPDEIQTDCRFRVTGKQPELWNAVTGETRDATDWRVENGQTVLPLHFDPCGSWFVVFRRPASPPAKPQPNFQTYEPLTELPGPWTVTFDTKLGGLKQITLQDLIDWSQSGDKRIKYYSGTAIYTTTFDAPKGPLLLNQVSRPEASYLSPPRERSVRRNDEPGEGDQAELAKVRHIYLDLGDLRELAEVTLNGKPLGILWTPPFRVDVTNLLQPKANRLEVKVTNFWPNRIIGDAVQGTHFTRTNIRQLTAQTPLMPSGLFGPVQLLRTTP